MELTKALSIAGFDGSGGAGIQADIKTFSALECYAATVLTSIPVQNTFGVRAIYDLPVSCVKEQMQAIFEDMHLHAVKIGMLHRKEIITSVADGLSKNRSKNIVLDPVMVAKSGDKLLLPEAISALKELLFPIADVITPNLAEASELLGEKICSKAQMEEAACELNKMGAKAVIVKGGHLAGDYCEDCLYTNGKIHWLSSPRVPTKNTHGTGCTFSAAIAAFLARTYSILESFHLAKNYLTQAIASAAKLEIGQGNGPVHHFHSIWRS